MYPTPTTLKVLMPGEPTPDALHREEYYHAAEASQPKPAARLEDPALKRRANLLRAQAIARMARFVSPRA